MGRIVVGLIGIKGAGKDTAAAHLVAHHNFERIAFADALYREAAGAFGVSVEFLNNRETKETPLPQLTLKHCTDSRFVSVVLDKLKASSRESDAYLLAKALSPRFILQLWGTEYRRKLDDDAYWLNQVKALIDARPEQNFVITDVRFNNEADFVESIGGLLLRVLRPVLEVEEAKRREAGDPTALHPSALELLHRYTKYEVQNDEGDPVRMYKDLDIVLATESQMRAIAA